MVVFPTPPFWLERTMVLAISKVTSVCCVVWCGNNLYMVIMRFFSVYLGSPEDRKKCRRNPESVDAERKTAPQSHYIITTNSRGNNYPNFFVK